jgi:hypothetical protein
MGLDLKGVPVTSRSTKERTRKALDILEEIQAQVAKMGLPEYPKPATAPTPLCDLDVGSLSNRELETQMTSYVAYAQYISPKLAEAESAYKISSANLKAVAASLKVSLFRDDVPKAELQARIATAPEYIEQELEHLKLYATRTILESYYQSYSKQAAGLSRIIELRKLEFEQELRANSVGSHKRGGLPGKFRRP